MIKHQGEPVEIETSPKLALDEGPYRIYHSIDVPEEKINQESAIDSVIVPYDRLLLLLTLGEEHHGSTAISEGDPRSYK